ncbi:RNA polymerase sigma-70 factor (ECF subfamily) [Roseimicrobium gellanilyticum]|uniref:RNA polymerase sigma-70 factor (ECF subfamily) n=1 Tax=Roseimicrobium gellanilyticum TaxID=748857 RepID=A0A366HQP1_9BACT|nr:RNA polymerase sigma factor [Roseimicrobium gellanilyticum]RBP45243.1 RNA polymerase sigma-70 factor (ECF subfamily) [Roseimicrobium gellanilyticum]
MDTTDQPPLLERLFAESAGDLARYFTRRHGVSAIVQDLVQETFLQMARGLKEGRQLKCARGYLFGIARHLSQAAWERKSREVVVPFDTVAAVADARTPVTVKDDRVDAARETIAALAPLQREVLELRFSQGLSYAEIAEALGIPVGTVRSRLHNAVAAVRERLETNP